MPAHVTLVTIDQVVGSALAASLQDRVGLDVVSAPPTRLGAIATSNVDLVVLDLQVPESLAHCKALADAGLRVLFLVDSPDDEELLAAVEAGAVGFAASSGGLRELEQTVNAALRGEACVPRRLLGGLLRGLVQRRRELDVVEQRLETLSAREREVLGLLGDGLDHKQIAQRLFISPETARTHIQRLLKKLAVRNRLEAANLAAEYGISRQGDVA
ncbi:MAG: LuxR C-terminal-related transcriptional regulator [Motilibacteraceae bacterium]